ncbi:Xylose import ATP-binding protein XylG [Rhodobacteraceae bacterium THAF1]|uniref:multiple monosaccharide ABC transporter ATP-binding protein n=1 Tax=Palleronia sp. THAF1 TaxID=2587842 RepID=UPI000F3EA981|nr:multiple monosaccharide ABC transporter ATP-binding protein [Palleronia sp. THAF1]QFU08097.1 Xylose import ATP-binding protein XylG [Palleronia sp. THAF1]VDC27956.1 Xylose import ATP-binding protein XylG [Rhodobacteraceae bacterium THAF1]
MATILEMRGITKEFPGVKALDDVNLAVEEGEIHALVGENGAGKSTLMKVLSGVYPHGSYTGDIVYDGDVQAFGSIRDSESRGIIIIHQELALIPLLSVAENIFLGNERARGGVIDWRETETRAADLLARVGLRESPKSIVADLGMGKQQLIEIAKALSKDVRLLILDEPTSSLNEQDSEKLLDLLVEFRKQGVTSILISHKLNEISRVADTITVLRDGSAVARLDCKDGISEDDIIRDMVGRSLDDRYPPRDPKIQDEIAMEVSNWTVHHPIDSDRVVVKDVSFHVKRGEVLGIAGLMGAGRTELAMSLFGRSYGRDITGTAKINGQVADLSSVRSAINAGLAYATEDRKTYGLVLDDTIRRNVPLAKLESISDGAVVNAGREAEVAERFRKRLNIKSSSIEQETVNLSGGNQQKVVLSKWLFADPDILILDEPCRGIDVGAKFEIYTVIRDLAASGKAIIVISSEMPELLGISDRLYVMNEGRFVGEMQTAEASQEKIMARIIKSGEDVL